MKLISSGTLAAILAGMMLVMPASAGKQHHRYHRQHMHLVKKHHIKKKIRRVAAKPVIRAVIDVSDQAMYVSVNGSSYATWRVSTGRAGYHSRAATLAFHAWPSPIIRRNTTTHPCPTRCFSVVEMLFMVPIIRWSAVGC